MCMQLLHEADNHGGILSWAATKYGQVDVGMACQKVCKHIQKQAVSTAFCRFSSTIAAFQSANIWTHTNTAIL